MLVGTDSLSRTGTKSGPQRDSATPVSADGKVLATPEMIIRAGELRRQTNAEVPLPTDPVARAIVAAGQKRRAETNDVPLPENRVARGIILSGMLRRGEITDEQYRALLNGGNSRRSA